MAYQDYCQECKGELECVGQTEVSLDSVYRCKDCCTEYVERTRLEKKMENKELLKIKCPQCRKGILLISQENGNQLNFNFDYIANEIVQETKEQIQNPKSYLIVVCESCDADFDISYDNKIIYWGLNLCNYIYQGQGLWEVHKED